jgi:hypothetical protein
MLILKNNHPPMRKLTQPWKLRRSFGSQPVGNVAGPRWPEAGIAAQELPSESSRWAFRGKVDSQCRPADLPFLVVDDHCGADSRIFLIARVRAFSGPPHDPSQLFPSPGDCPKIFFRHYPPLVKPRYLTGNSEDPGTLPWKAPEFFHAHLPVARPRIVFHS